MAQSPAVKRAQRSLTTLLIIIVALVGVIALGVWRSDATWTPKLALDLQGGTQILLAPKLADGQSVSGEQLNQAVEIIRQRVDASGVSEAEITTQGSQNISVSIPGKADDATLQRIEASAKLDFRPVLLMGANTGAPQQQAEDGQPEGEQVTAEGQEAAPVEGADAPPAEGDAAAADGTGTPADPAAEGQNVDPSPLPKTAYDQAWMTEGLV